MRDGYRRLTDQAPRTLFGRRQPVHRQLRHHGAAAGQPGHHLAAALPAGAGAERAVPRLPHLGARRDRQRHARQRIVGDRRHLPALRLRLRNTRSHRHRRTIRAVHVHLLPRRRPRCAGSAAPRTRRGRPATTPPVRRRAPTWAADTDPTPRGRFTIPTPYGGPVLPIEPPR